MLMCGFCALCVFKLEFLSSPVIKIQNLHWFSSCSLQVFCIKQQGGIIMSLCRPYFIIKSNWYGIISNSSQQSVLCVFCVLTELLLSFAIYHKMLSNVALFLDMDAFYSCEMRLDL